MSQVPPRRPRWPTVGYYLTAGWVLLVAATTGGDRSQPLFDYIFTVPLAGWIVALVVSHLRDRFRRRR